MPDKPLRDAIVPVIARHDQVVEVHWRLKDGTVKVVAYECPELTPAINIPS